MLPHTRRRLSGPPVVLPAVLDRAAESWFRARPRTRGLLACLLAAVALLAGVTHAASAPHGPPVAVWVASRDLSPGDLVTEDATERRSWPEDLVPDGALERPGGTVTAPLPRGAVVTDRHLGDTGIAHTLPAGRVAVPVPAEQLPALVAGTRLDLVGPGPDGIGQQLAAGARVLADEGDILWIALDPQDAVAVSAAVAAGTIGAVVLPP